MEKKSLKFPFLFFLIFAVIIAFIFSVTDNWIFSFVCAFYSGFLFILQQIFFSQYGDKHAGE